MVIRLTLLACLLLGGLTDTPQAWAQDPPDAAPSVAPAVSVADQLSKDLRVAKMRIPPGRERLAKKMLQDVGFLKPLDGGWHFDTITLHQRHVVMELRPVGAADGVPAAGTLTLTPRAVAGPGARTSESFTIVVDAVVDDAQVGVHLEAAAKSVVTHDKGGFYEEIVDAHVPAIEAPVELGPELERSLSDRWRTFHSWPHSEKLVALRHLAYAGAVLLVWALVLIPMILRRRQDYAIIKRVRTTHLLPTGIQLILFAYWSLYWDEVPLQIQLIGLQVIFAYGFDALLGLSLFKRWTVSYGPIPIALSANLFVWFPGDHFYLSVVVIALALASKALLRRDGRHIFNPSAFAIAIVGALCISWPSVFPYVDIAHQLNLPPNMLELIFLLALVPQLRIPIVLVSASAMFVTYVITASHPMLLPGPMWPAVFLAFVLLATDPVTIPRTGGGRVLFGVALAAVTVIVSSTLEYNGISDFYGKVLAIPVANFFVPHFDQLGARYLAKAESWLGPERNRAHVVAWIVLVFMLGAGGVSKEGAFEAVWHREKGTAHVVVRDGGATCEDNPVWCEPFSFGAEWSLWFTETHEGAP